MRRGHWLLVISVALAALACVVGGAARATPSGDSRASRPTAAGLRFLGSFTSSPGGYWVYPVAVATDAAGDVYVAEEDYSSNGRIEKFSRTGAFITRWGSGGSGDGQFFGTMSLAIDPAGNVYVGDDNDRIQKFSSTGVFITKWGSHGSGAGQFDSLRGLATDAAGNVYVGGGGSARIQKFSSTGTFITQWGSFGEGNGQFHYPGGVATDAAGNLYVADGGFETDRIQKFSSTGAFITTWGGAGSGDGQFEDPKGVATDAAGNVYVVDFFNDQIQKFSSTGAFITKAGSAGSGDGQFKSPAGVAIDRAAGYLYVADVQNHRIDKFSILPELSALSITPNVLTATGQGAQVRYTLSEPTKVGFSVQRETPGHRDNNGGCVANTALNRLAKTCTRLIAVDSFVIIGKAGVNNFHFAGRLANKLDPRSLAHKLDPGRYWLLAAPIVGPGKGASASEPFQIKVP